ncbi:hypothetical protein [Brevundimonas sp.]|uniref:hypothetical protein n=1 Tax=Brevundimonas sp. TaxID=1871086 RepID=UPI002D392C19|nr:hypothetical protein [Brevundimonas sp.]HYC66674.1 hypothetical protein [Brevundimonas sp.]
MSGGKHTAGWSLKGDHEWSDCHVEFDRSGSYYTIYEDGRYLPVAFAIGAEGDDDTARARLIAAAPCLLDQHGCELSDLRFLLRAIEEGDPKAELILRVKDMIERESAAIAKATAADTQPSIEKEG